MNRKILLEFELKGKEFMENKTGFRVCWMLLVLGAWFVSPALAKDVVIKLGSLAARKFNQVMRIGIRRIILIGIDPDLIFWRTAQQ